jgi:hypothetical protein
LKGVVRVAREGDICLVYSDQDVRERISELAYSLGAPLLHLRLRGYGVEEIYFKYFREG